MKPWLLWYLNHTKTQQRELRPNSFMNNDGKILNKILANWIQEHTKRIIHHEQVGFIPGMRRYFNIWISNNVIHYINRIKEKKNYMIISLDSEKGFDKIQHPFIIKVLEQSGFRGTHLKIVKAVYSKPVANIKINGENLKQSDWNQGLYKAVHSLSTCSV